MSPSMAKGAAAHQLWGIGQAQHQAFEIEAADCHGSRRLGVRFAGKGVQYGIFDGQ